ncbi:MAG: hypothetical protein ABUK01_01505 [Leptospirales bacterium]
MEMSYIISIALGIATSVFAVLINLIMRKQGDDLSPWSGWQLGTTIRIMGFLICGTILYLYIKQNSIEKSEGTIAYMMLFITITSGMVVDMFISLSGIKGITETRLSK